MASAARTASRAFSRSIPATSSLRPAARSSRFALQTQTLRFAPRRGYASEAEPKKSSNTWLWIAGIAVAGGYGAYLYRKGDSPLAAKTFAPTKEDYQKVYDEVARLLVEKDDYDDGSYGPVCSNFSGKVAYVRNRAVG